VLTTALWWIIPACAGLRRGARTTAEYIKRQTVFDSLPIVTEDKTISLYGAVADFMVLVSAIPAADVVEVVQKRLTVEDLENMTESTPVWVEQYKEWFLCKNGILRNLNGFGWKAHKLVDGGIYLRTFAPSCDTRMDGAT
jgi:hypothetical protein